MDLYDEAMANGVSRPAAMYVAAQQMARTMPSRPHGGRRSPAVEPGPEAPIGTEDFDAAVRKERTRQADGAPEATYAEELERLGAGGHAAAQALHEILAARSGQELRHSQTAAATPDDPVTPDVNEHIASGLPRSTRAVGDAERDHAGARTAAQLAAEWFPDGLHRPGAVPAHVANRRPANALAQAHNANRNAVRTR
jgi:hypothetical protein